MILMKDEICADPSNMICNGNIDICNGRCQIACAYIPGTQFVSVYSSIFANDSKTQTDEMLEYLSRIIEEARRRDPTCRIVIGGDFNIPKLIDPEKFLIFGLSGGDCDKLEDKFVRFIGKHDLETKNHHPTHDPVSYTHLTLPTNREV